MFGGVEKRKSMKGTFKRYRLLDGSEKDLLSRVGDGNIIRLFDKTPYPRNRDDVVCPHFLELACISGCAYNCSYCYLKGTFRFWQRENGRIPFHKKDIRQISVAIDEFLRLEIPGTVLNTSELADGLQAETDFYGQPFSKFLMDRFLGTDHKLLFLSKGTYVKNFLENEWQKNAILSWSLNAYSVAERWEKLAPAVQDRLRAAKQVFDRGYEVRLRIDPMVAVEGYEKEYRDLVDSVFSLFEPARITLGCLRGLPATIARAKDKSWVSYLSERSNWGGKPSIESRFSLYSTVIEHLKDKYGYRNMAVCKDTLEIWAWLEKRFGLEHRKIKCNCIP